MLPEQRVWKAQELKDQARLLYDEAGSEEKMQREWYSFDKNDRSIVNRDGKKGGIKTLGIRPDDVSPNNSAVILITPDVMDCGENTKAKVMTLVHSHLAAFSMNVVEEGDVTGSMIAEHGIIDAHYGSIAEKAFVILPHQLEITTKQRNIFEKAFGLTWEDALRSNQLINAKQALDEIATTHGSVEMGASERALLLGKFWEDCIEEKESRIVELGKGFYIGKVSLCTPIMRGNEETVKRSHGAEADATQSTVTELQGFAAEGGEDHGAQSFDLRPTSRYVRYVVNGFYPRTRVPYLCTTAKVHYLIVEWRAPPLTSLHSSDKEVKLMSWSNFREKVIGSTNPAEAQQGSLRRSLYDKWEELGLRAQPGVHTSGIQGSGSPFEALAEKMKWAVPARSEGATNAYQCFSVNSDSFGRALLEAGLREENITSWFNNPMVTFEGKRRAIFELLKVCPNALFLCGLYRENNALFLAKDLDAPVCLLKACAIASDAYGKLSAAKIRYLEAVSFVEGEHIYDPDGTSRRTSDQKVLFASLLAKLASQIDC